MTQGALQLKTKLLLPVIGIIGMLKVALIAALADTTPVARLSGVTDETVGAGALVTPPLPRIGLCPLSLPPPQPAASALNSNAVNHGKNLEHPTNLFIFIPCLLYPKHQHNNRPLHCWSASFTARNGCCVKFHRLSITVRLSSFRSLPNIVGTIFLAGNLYADAIAIWKFNLFQSPLFLSLLHAPPGRHSSG